MAAANCEKAEFAISDAQSFPSFNSSQPDGVSSELDFCECLENTCATLSGFFLKDPANEGFLIARNGLKHLAQDPEGWPFGEERIVRQSLRHMAALLEGEHNLPRLSHEYRCLFVGPNKLKAPPWGSVYTDRECVIFGESTLALNAWMRRNAIVRAGTENQPCDHIGVELALVSWLAGRKPDLLCEFLREHVLSWSYRYFEALRNAAHGGFYDALAQLSDTTLRDIQQTLLITVSFPRYYR